MNIQHELQIAASPARVWDITIDVEALPELTPTMTDVVKLESGPLVVGSTVRIKQPAQRSKVWTVTELEPSRRFSWTTTSAAITMTAIHDLTETATGTSNTLSVEIGGRLAPVIGRLLRRPIAKALAVENEAIKATAEGGGEGSG